MTEITLKGIQDKEAMTRLGIKLPDYDVKAVQDYTAEHPVWVHFGPGNIFRCFIGELQQRLLNKGFQTSGIEIVSDADTTFIDKVCLPHDYITLSVTLLPDTKVELEAIGSITKGYRYNGTCSGDEAKVKAIFANPSLQLVSYTITEKGYALKGIDGKYLPKVEADFANGPSKVSHTMSLTAALLLQRYQNGAAPLALVSMDNCSHNGDKLKAAVLTIAQEWLKRGFVDQGFIDYLNDSKKVSFPWTMIDKITPRPDPEIEKKLEGMGIKDMHLYKSARGSFLAPFVNAEKPQYLIVEDNFPNGRPPLEKAGVLFTDKQGVDLCERMKVTTCLNPLHTTLAVYGCVLGYDRISSEMDDADLVKLISKLGYDEGLKVVDDPKILSPKAFIDEVIKVRLPNRCLPDTPQRIATDTSLKVPVRFGETVKNYARKGLDASKLTALPLAIAGWLRYLMAVDDEGKAFTPSADPQLNDLQSYMKGIVFGQPDTVGDKLKPILSNASLFGEDLYKVGLGHKVESLFAELIAGPGAVRATLKKYTA